MLKLVYIYRTYRKIKTGVPFFGTCPLPTQAPPFVNHEFMTAYSNAAYCCCRHR